jgi:hypothetical protein
MATEPAVAAELLHLPDKPAGVERARMVFRLAGELLHLPDKPAGVATRQLKIELH